MEASSARTTVKVISVLFFIGALVSLAAAVLLFIASSMAASGELPDLGATATEASFLLSLFAGILLLHAVYDVAVGIGLWQFKKWARILLLIGAWFWAALSVLTIFGNASEQQWDGFGVGLVMLLISAILLWLFQFNDAVRAQFRVVAAVQSSPKEESMMLSPLADAIEAAVPIVTVANPVSAATSKGVARAPARRAAKPVKKATKSVKVAPKKAVKKVAKAAKKRR